MLSKYSDMFNICLCLNELVLSLKENICTKVSWNSVVELQNIRFLGAWICGPYQSLRKSKIQI